jgi:hypothetical protein
MRSFPFTPWFGAVLLAGAVACLASAEQAESKSALETHPIGWIDLLKDKDLKDWKRVPIPVGSKLSERNPWKLEGQTLLCDGVKIHEMLLYDKEFSDGIFHVEWRFRKLEGDAKYNSGVYVRTSADGKVWHQAQVGNLNVGYLFGDTLVDGKLKRETIKSKVPQRGKPAGEWNVFEITCKGKDVTLWVNGAVTCEWNNCQVPKGHVGLEAEGYVIEFKNVKFRPLAPGEGK